MIGLATRAAIVGVIAAAAMLAANGIALATIPCDNWINTAGGSWDTGSNWSLGSAPTSTEDACITAGGTYTVVIGNETITVADLTIGGSGSNPTLQIGNGGSGSPNISVSGAINNESGSTVDYGWGGTFSAGSMTNAGTFEVPSTGYSVGMTFGDVTNSGTFSVAGGTPDTLSLTSGSTFDNAGGTISNAASSTLAISTSGSPAATLELDSGGAVDNSGTITVADTVLMDGGSICGNALTVGGGDGGAAGTLNFAGTPGTGPACTGGAATDQIFVANVTATLSGTIPSAYTVTIGDGGSSFNHTTLSGTVTNEGTMLPGFGATVSGGSLTNTGSVTVPASIYPTALNIPITNQGQLTVNGSTSASLVNFGWSNTSTGTMTLASGIALPLTSPSGDTGSFTQDGVIDSSGTLSVADPVTINGGSICGNALNLGSEDGGTGATLSFANSVPKGPACAKGLTSDHVFIYNVTATLETNIPRLYTVAIGDGGSSFARVGTASSTLTNAGTLEPGYEATLTVGSGGSGNLINQGTITVPANIYTTTLDATDVTNSGTFTSNATLDVNLASGGVFVNSLKGKLIGAKGNLNLAGPLQNDGILTIDAKETISLLPVGSTPSDFTQESSATLVDPIGKTFGVLSVSGVASLGGTVNLTPKGFTPAYGSATTFISDGSTAGTFSTVTPGPYTLAYGSTDVQAIGRPTATTVLSPTSGTAPVKVKVTGAGYQSGETVEVYLDSTSSTALGSVKATSSGTINVTVTIPSGTSPGSHSVITLGQSSGQSASATFTVNGTSAS